MAQTEARKESAAFAPERVRGRQHGVEVEWTRTRFADVIRREVATKTEHGWSRDHIWSWLKSAYELDERSSAVAKAALEHVVRTLPAPSAEKRR
jgi:hypothetical protein